MIIKYLEEGSDMTYCVDGVLYLKNATSEQCSREEKAADEERRPAPTQQRASILRDYYLTTTFARCGKGASQ